MKINGVEVWTVPEAAEHFDTSPSIITRGCRSKWLEGAYKLGRSWYIPVEPNKDKKKRPVGYPKGRARKPLLEQNRTQP
jgi:hypothetical protein